MSESDSQDLLRSKLEFALEFRDFAAAHAVLIELGYEVNSRPLQLCEVGYRVSQLDGEDFEQLSHTPGLPSDVASFLKQCSWPTSLADADGTALDDLIPTFQLLLEIAELKTVRRDWPDVLAVIHLISEYLPLLAWQPVLGHAGRPDKLQATLVGRSMHHKPCSLNNMQHSQIESLLSLRLRDESFDLDEYVRKDHSRMADALTECSGRMNLANNLTSVVFVRMELNHSKVPEESASIREKEDLAFRTSIARAFSESAIVHMRHTSPVGHFFAVPGKSKVTKEWYKSTVKINNLARLYDQHRVASGDGPLVKESVSGSFPVGLSDLVTIAAGVEEPLVPSNVLAILASGILDQVWS